MASQRPLGSLSFGSFVRWRRRARRTLEGAHPWPQSVAPAGPASPYPGSSVKMLGKAQGLPADQVFLDLEDAVAPLAKPDARKNIVAALNEGDWARQDPGGPGQRPDHAVDLPGRHRGGRGRRRQPGLHHAAEGAERRAGAVAGPDADPAGEDARPGGRPDRHRGADRERRRAGQRGRDRRRLAPGGDDHLRPGRLHGLDQHEVAGGRRAASRTTRATRTTTS